MKNQELNYFCTLLQWYGEVRRIRNVLYLAILALANIGSEVDLHDLHVNSSVTSWHEGEEHLQMVSAASALSSRSVCHPCPLPPALLQLPWTPPRNAGGERGLCRLSSGHAGAVGAANELQPLLLGCGWHAESNKCSQTNPCTAIWIIPCEQRDKQFIHVWSANTYLFC